MRFLIDRCAGRLIADWLRDEGHDVVESRERGVDPGDDLLLLGGKRRFGVVLGAHCVLMLTKALRA